MLAIPFAPRAGGALPDVPAWRFHLKTLAVASSKICLLS
jgi:hypothetical protein